MRQAVLSLLLAFLCVAVVYGQRPGNLAGTVVNVADGDTISIVDKRKIVHLIRLSGIDAPEKGQKYSEQAQQYLSSLIYGKDVTVEGKSYDRFGRLRGKVLLKGRDINLEMVIAGFAWHYNEVAWDQTERDRQLYEAAEVMARKSKFSIWTDAKPIPPWDFDSNAVSAEAEEKAPESRASVLSPKSVDTAQRNFPNLLTVALPSSGKIIGNKNSRIYHWPGCPGYSKIAEKNQVPFNSTADAEAAGYRPAKNCGQ
jgi:endonuclease YncB( thermonuclease family)